MIRHLGRAYYTKRHQRRPKPTNRTLSLTGNSGSNTGSYPAIPFAYNHTQYMQSPEAVELENIWMNALNLSKTANAYDIANANSSNDRSNSGGRFQTKARMLVDIMESPNAGRGASSSLGNGGVHPHSFTTVMAIASLFLFFTLTVTVALIIFCRKKNVVFAFNKRDHYATGCDLESGGGGDDLDYEMDAMDLGDTSIHRQYPLEEDSEDEVEVGYGSRRYTQISSVGDSGDDDVDEDGYGSRKYKQIGNHGNSGDEETGYGRRNRRFTQISHLGDDANEDTIYMADKPLMYGSGDTRAPIYCPQPRRSLSSTISDGKGIYRSIRGSSGDCATSDSEHDYYSDCGSWNGSPVLGRHQRFLSNNLSKHTPSNITALFLVTKTPSPTSPSQKSKDSSPSQKTKNASKDKESTGNQSITALNDVPSSALKPRQGRQPDRSGSSDNMEVDKWVIGSPKILKCRCNQDQSPQQNSRHSGMMIESEDKLSQSSNDYKVMTPDPSRHPQDVTSSHSQIVDQTTKLSNGGNIQRPTLTALTSPSQVILPSNQGILNERPVAQLNQDHIPMLPIKTPSHLAHEDAIFHNSNERSSQSNQTKMGDNTTFYQNSPATVMANGYQTNIGITDAIGAKNCADQRTLITATKNNNTILAPPSGPTPSPLPPQQHPQRDNLSCSCNRLLNNRASASANGLLNNSCVGETALSYSAMGGHNQRANEGTGLPLTGGRDHKNNLGEAGPKPSTGLVHKNNNQGETISKQSLARADAENFVSDGPIPCGQKLPNNHNHRGDSDISYDQKAPPNTLYEQNPNMDLNHSNSLKYPTNNPFLLTTRTKPHLVVVRMDHDDNYITSSPNNPPIASSRVNGASLKSRTLNSEKSIGMATRTTRVTMDATSENHANPKHSDRPKNDENAANPENTANCDNFANHSNIANALLAPAHTDALAAIGVHGNTVAIHKDSIATTGCVYSNVVATNTDTYKGELLGSRTEMKVKDGVPLLRKDWVLF